jgi:hypothetical protein
MPITTRPIPELPNHFKINIRKPPIVRHELSLKIEVLSINDYYMSICTVANLRILEMINGQYICAIQDDIRSAFCIGKDSYDQFIDADVITLYSVMPKIEE